MKFNQRLIFLLLLHLHPVRDCPQSLSIALYDVTKDSIVNSSPGAAWYFLALLKLSVVFTAEDPVLGAQTQETENHGLNKLLFKFVFFSCFPKTFKYDSGIDAIMLTIIDIIFPVSHK